MALTLQAAGRPRVGARAAHPGPATSLAARRDALDLLFGPHADSHTMMAVQMATRSIIVFFAALALWRLSGPRTFGGRTAFYLVVKIILGAILSRAVGATSLFWGTLLAGQIFRLLHRGLAWASSRYPWVDKLVKGRAYLLAEKGQSKPEQLHQLNLTDKDLRAGLHTNGSVSELAQTEAVYLERDGSISVAKKKAEPS